MRINEIFYSLQGEGHFAGTPSVFIRFSGCNLQCPFCDTAHQEGTEMSEDDIVAHIKAYPARHVVLTGGEPALFVTESLCNKIHAAERFIAIETNGTKALPQGIDWVTLSPKDAFIAKANVVVKKCDELKVIFNGNEPESYDDITAKHRYLQPCDVGDSQQNALLVKKAIEYCLAHPQWKLSLQTHKILDIR